MGLGDLLLTLQQRNQMELQAQLGETTWERLLVWAQVDARSIQTQAQLVEAGAVEALPRRGREAIQYLMTGTARLAL